jgi:hypothetical protein
MRSGASSSRSASGAAVLAVRQQLQGRVPALITSDGYAAYAEVFRRVFSQTVKPKHRRGQPNPGGPKRVLDAGLTFATVTKEVKKGRVVKVRRELVLGSRRRLDAALAGTSRYTATTSAGA